MCVDLKSSMRYLQKMESQVANCIRKRLCLQGILRELAMATRSCRCGNPGCYPLVPLMTQHHPCDVHIHAACVHDMPLRRQQQTSLKKPAQSSSQAVYTANEKHLTVSRACHPTSGNRKTAFITPHSPSASRPQTTMTIPPPRSTPLPAH